jgi:predicted RNA-binding Zn-ribbon protein involved in translation (DUF1610 family)
MHCQKCGYARTPSDTAPDHACPQCGAVYAKVVSASLRGSTETAVSPAPAVATTPPRKTLLSKCDACEGVVARDAEICPHCGRPFVVPERLVTVTDVQMRFWSMVVFMVKWAIASIPAAVLLIFIGVATFGLLSGIFTGLSSAR